MYRNEISRLLYQNALNKYRAAKRPRLSMRAKRTKFRQRFRKRLPNMPFPPAGLTRFNRRARRSFIDRSLRRQAIARSRKVVKRDLFDDQMKKIERRALKRGYTLIPRSVKLERAIEKKKFRKAVRQQRIERKHAFRKLTRQELRRSGLTEREVQEELNRRSRAGEPPLVPGEHRIFPGFAPRGFPGPGAPPGPRRGGPFDGPPSTPSTETDFDPSTPSTPRDPRVPRLRRMPPGGPLFPFPEEEGEEEEIFLPDDSPRLELEIPEFVVPEFLPRGERERIRSIHEATQEMESDIQRLEQFRRNLIRDFPDVPGIENAELDVDPRTGQVFVSRPTDAMARAFARRGDAELAEQVQLSRELAQDARIERTMTEQFQLEARIRIERLPAVITVGEYDALVDELRRDFPTVPDVEEQVVNMLQEHRRGEREEEEEQIERDEELDLMAEILGPAAPEEHETAEELIERTMEEEEAEKFITLARGPFAPERPSAVMIGRPHRGRVRPRTPPPPSPELKREIQKRIATSPELRMEMAEQQRADQIAKIEEERARRQLEEEQARRLLPSVPQLPVGTRRVTFQEPSPLIHSDLPARQPVMPGGEEFSERERRAGLTREERFQERALRLQIALSKEKLHDIASEQREKEFEKEFEKKMKEMKKKGKGKSKGGGLVSGKYSKRDIKAFQKQHDIQVDIFRMERERRAALHSRPIESIAAEADERRGRKPNKYMQAIKRVKKAYPYISDKDAMKGGQESFGEGKAKSGRKYKKKSEIRGEASRIASKTNPWIIHLKKVMPGLKKKYPGKSHKQIMGMVKETYTPVKKKKKKKGGNVEILPAQIVGSGKKGTAWMKHLKKMQKKFPNLTYGQCMMVGKKTYKNKKAMKKMKKMLKGGEFYGIK